MLQTIRRLTTIFLFALLYIGIQSCSSHPTGTEDSIVKSANDNRQYHSFTLPNQLKVLVISDPDTDKAAAALDVHVGSNANPEGRQGLAHFLEHMLFLGTEKYPEAGGYQKFISEHGGTHNAYTDFEHTNYFFDVDKDFLAPTLDRFAQFFIAPLFNADYVEREKHAVDSEYQSKLKDDYRRQYEVIKSIANPEHPFSAFFVGSLETLADRPNQPVRKDLVDFYQRHYSANLMSLVVLGHQSVDELEALVKAQFTHIPNHQSTRIEITQPLFEKSQLPLKVEITPEKDIRQLTLHFPMPSLYNYYRSKPTYYIANLLGHEGPGSLLSLLKNLGWVESLYAGVGHNASDASTFQISYSLTAAGLTQTDQVIQTTFAYIRLILDQGINAWRFKEQQRLAQMDFDFKENGRGIHEVTTLATQLHHYPTQDLLRAPYLFEHFDPQLIQKLIAKLRPENMIVMLVAKEAQTDQLTDWFKTPHSISSISPEQIAGWLTPLPENLQTQLTLPEANPFIAQDLSVKPNLAKGALPLRVKIADGLTLWHLQDTSFNTPRADFYFAIRSPKANDTPAHRLLTELYIKAVNDQLSEFSYPAYLAGLNYQLYRHVRGLSVRISGYQDKQLVLLEDISKKLKTPVLREEKFAIFKNEISRDLENAQKDQPYNQSLSQVSELMLLSAWPEQELIRTLNALTLADLEAFIREYQEKIEIVALANGNLTLDDAKRMAQLLQHEFLSTAAAQPVPHQPMIKLPTNKALLHSLKVDHPDSAITAYIQGDDKSVSTAARFALFNQVLSAPFYQALRTEQQRGYIVFATSMNLMDVPATALVIQSPNTSAVDLAHHIDEFLRHFNAQVQTMSKAEFSKHQNALVTRILEQETRLSERSGRLWQEIDRENYQFDQRERLAATVSAYSLDNFKQEYSDYFLGEKKRSLTVMANGERFPLDLKAIKTYISVKTRDALPQRFF